MIEPERFCIMSTRDKHESLEGNLRGTPVAFYLRDTEYKPAVHPYIAQVQAIEALCFRQPAENWTLAHFALNGPGMIVTAEITEKPVGAQYVTADCWDGKAGLRFWTTVVHPELRKMRIASWLTAVSTLATQSWARFGGTICDTDSSLMGRNVRLEPLVVTANMHHTPRRRKVQLEWKTPDDALALLVHTVTEAENFIGQDLPLLETLADVDVTDLPPAFRVSAQAKVWEDIALNPGKYRRFFKLGGWLDQQKEVVLRPTEKAASTSMDPSRTDLQTPLTPRPRVSSPP